MKKKSTANKTIREIKQIQKYSINPTEERKTGKSEQRRNKKLHYERHNIDNYIKIHILKTAIKN